VKDYLSSKERFVQRMKVTQSQGEGVDEVVDEQKHLLVENAAVDLEARDSSTERSELETKKK